MKRDDVLGGKNFNADDLRGGDLTLTISEVTQEEFKQDDGYKQKKLVVAFRGKEKRLVCGKIKAGVLFDMLGDDTDDWVGQRVRLCLGKTTFAGKRVDCVDIKEPAQRPATAPAANGRARQTAAAQVDEDGGETDDETPF